MTPSFEMNITKSNVKSIMMAKLMANNDSQVVWILEKDWPKYLENKFKIFMASSTTWSDQS